MATRTARKGREDGSDAVARENAEHKANDAAAAAATHVIRIR
jgi:hypothetical protein